MTDFGAYLKKVTALLSRLSQRRFLAFYLFAFCLLFQATVISKLVILYTILKVLFVGLLFLLAASFLKAAAKKKVLVLIVLAIILIRLPFFFHSTGLITMSDNALEALQSQEIQDSRTVPYYQFEILSHQGTLRYLLISFIWDFTGTQYLALILWNCLVFIGIILLLAKLLEPIVPKPAVVLLSTLSFAFIETMLDFSLLIRGSVYLDALLLVLLAIYVFDLQFKHKTPIFLSYYFLSFAVYIQPIALLFAGSFLVCTAAFSLKHRRFWTNAWLFLAGGSLGIFHVVYYELFFRAKPVFTTSLEQIRLIPLSALSLGLFGNIFRYAREAFLNLCQYEFTYFMGTVKAGPAENTLAILNTIGLYVSLAVFFIGLGIVAWKLIGLLRKKIRFDPDAWPYLFFAVLLLGSIVKLAVLLPPRLEPRHNIDLLLLIVLAYFFVLALLFRGKKFSTPKIAVTAVLLLAFTAPHYYFFLKNAMNKEASYTQLMTALSYNKVTNLATDFNLAYPVYFLSQRKILCSDTMGPMTLGGFYPELRAKVDALPDTDKSFLFYSEAAGTREWHKRATRRLMNETRTRLRQEDIAFKTVSLKDYTLIIPKKHRLENVPDGEKP